jgi:hypothetical protein
MSSTNATAARLVMIVTASAAVLGLSCSDPVLDDTVDAQGNETEGVEKGEFHRVGQRCVACHQENGEASDSAFTLAGTVFAQPNRQVGVGDVEIRLTDSDGSKHTARTNCVGNFFVKAADWSPKFPILVDIFKNNVRRSMRSPIGRAADCAECHQLANPPVDPFSQMGHIYLFTSDEPGKPNGDDICPKDPIRPGTQ